ncbi:hypothetical protein THUN1379_31090 [Paludibacterium sp. THUN1379]|uniref:hypothetical protein n=1 Tax=Paludibacterium sp. THUN1379 TaxID=3112107 RepID=UPI0030875F64|nr:hypothetical protein THUN1379_31090 [Paludibacterium sp. THUN1379]
MSKPGFKHSLMRCALAALFVSPCVMAQSPFAFVITGDTQYARTTGGDCGTSNSSSDNVCKSDANYMVDSFTHAVNHIPDDYPGTNLTSLWVNGSQTAHGTQSELNFVSSAWTQGVKVFLPNVFFGLGPRDLAGGATISNWVNSQVSHKAAAPDNANLIYVYSQNPTDNAYSVNIGKVHVVQMVDIKLLSSSQQQSFLSGLQTDLNIARQAGQIIVVMMNDSTDGPGMTSLVNMLRQYQVSAVFAANDENEVGQISRDADGSLWEGISKFQIGSVVAGTGLMVQVDPDRAFMTVSALQVQATGGTYSLEKVGDYLLTSGPNTLPYHVDFYSGNNQGGVGLCSISDVPGLNTAFDIKDSAAPCKNDAIRSGFVWNAVAGSEIKVFDSPSYSTSDDYTVIHFKQDLPFPMPLNTFEQSFENEYVKVQLHYKNGLDGKISAINGSFPLRDDLVQYDFNLYHQTAWRFDKYTFGGVGGQASLSCNFNSLNNAQHALAMGSGAICRADVEAAVLRRMPQGASVRFLSGFSYNGTPQSYHYTNGVQLSAQANASLVGVPEIGAFGSGQSVLTTLPEGVHWSFIGSLSNSLPITADGLVYDAIPGITRDVSLDGAGSDCNFWMHQRYFASDFQTDTANICRNNAAKTVTVRAAEAGDTLVLYDYPNQDKSHDYTEVYFKTPLRSQRQLTDLDNDYEDDDIKITHVGDHVMDGVDSIEIYNHQTITQEELANASSRDLQIGGGNGPIDCDGTSQSFDNGTAPSGFAQRNAPARVNVGRPQCDVPQSSATPVLKLYTGNGAASASSVPACVVPITGGLQEGTLGSGEFASCPTSNIASVRVEHAKAGEQISFFPTEVPKPGSALGSSYTGMLIKQDLTAPVVLDSLNGNVDVEAYSVAHFGKAMSEIKSLSLSGN